MVDVTKVEWHECAQFFAMAAQAAVADPSDSRETCGRVAFHRGNTRLLSLAG